MTSFWGKGVELSINNKGYRAKERDSKSKTAVRKKRQNKSSKSLPEKLQSRCKN
jgi:hypothetical protein